MQRTKLSLTTCVALVVAAMAAVANPTPAAVKAPQRGELVDVGDYSLFLDCIGSGSPTVIIAGGAGGWSIHYRHIQEALAGTTRACTYDRAGQGYSQAAPLPRDASSMADELHRLVHGAALEPPFVLVGHSLGGYVVRIYQRRYGSEVAALVLAESAHEDQYFRLPPSALAATEAGAAQMRQLAAAAEAGMLSRQQVPEWTLAPAFRAEYEEAMLEAVTYETMAAEIGSATASAAQVPDGDLGDLPLVVVTAGNSFAAFEGIGIPVDEANEVWLELQDELVGLSTNAVQLTSPTADHRINRTAPDLFVEGIEQAVEMARGADGSALPDPLHRLPERSTEPVDRLLARLEDAYRSMDTEAFVGLFTDDFEQLDVSRRVLVRGADDWRAQTNTLNAAHSWMERVHHGRVVVDDRTVVVEIEWAGEVKAAALEVTEDRAYRYAGVGLIELRDGRIARQVLFSDFPTLARQLGLGSPEWAAVDKR